MNLIVVDRTAIVREMIEKTDTENVGPTGHRSPLVTKWGNCTYSNTANRYIYWISIFSTSVVKIPRANVFF